MWILGNNGMFSQRGVGGQINYGSQLGLSPAKIAEIMRLVLRYKYNTHVIEGVY